MDLWSYFCDETQCGGMDPVTDLVQLSWFIKRPKHPFQPVKDMIQSLDPEARYFVTLDAGTCRWPFVKNRRI